MEGGEVHAKKNTSLKEGIVCVGGGGLALFARSRSKRGFKGAVEALTKAVTAE